MNALLSPLEKPFKEHVLGPLFFLLVPNELKDQDVGLQVFAEQLSLHFNFETRRYGVKELVCFFLSFTSCHGFRDVVVDVLLKYDWQIQVVHGIVCDIKL